MSISPKIASFDINEIINSLPGNVYWISSDGFFLGCNQNQAKSHGFASTSKVIGKHIIDISKDSKEVIDRILKNNALVIKSGQSDSFEEPLTMANGDQLIVLSKKVTLKDSKGNISGILGISIDITKEVLSASGTREKNFILEKIIAMTPGTLYWLDRQGVYQGCNDNEAKAIGLKSRHDIVGKTNKDLKGFLIPEALDPVNETVMSTNSPITLEEPAVLKDGTNAIFLSSKTPLHNDDGKVIGLVGISVDITDKKQAERLKREKLIAEKRSETMTLMSAAIAHELQTPQMAVGMTAEQLEHVWPALLAGCQAAHEAGLDVPTIPKTM